MGWLLFPFNLLLKGNDRSYGFPTYLFKRPAPLGWKVLRSNNKKAIHCMVNGKDGDKFEFEGKTYIVKTGF